MAFQKDKLEANFTIIRMVHEYEGSYETPCSKQRSVLNISESAILLLSR